MPKDVVIAVQRDVVKGWCTLGQWHSQADLHSRLAEVARRMNITSAVLEKVADSILFNFNVAPINTVDLGSRVSSNIDQVVVMLAPVAPEPHVIKTVPEITSEAEEVSSQAVASSSSEP